MRALTGDSLDFSGDLILLGLVNSVFNSLLAVNILLSIGFACSFVVVLLIDLGGSVAAVLLSGFESVFLAGELDSGFLMIL